MNRTKKLCLLFALVFVVSVSQTAFVFADSGKEINVFYNFDGYTQDPLNHIYPDDNWTYDMTVAGDRGKYGGYYDSETDNYIMLLKKGCEASLLFNEVINTGKLHISFVAKLDNTTTKPLIIMYDSGNPDISSVGGEYYSKLLFINYSAENVISYYDTGTSDSLRSWKSKESSIDDMDLTQWHRYDFITNDMTQMASAKIDYYIDGRKINDDSILFGNSGGFKSLSFRLEGTGDMHLDNLRIRRYYEDSGIEGNINGNTRVQRVDPEISVLLSECVDSNLITKENISIKNVTKETTVDNFDILEKTVDSFKIKINGELSTGIYNIKFSDNIIGQITGLAMLKPVKFRTEHKTVNVDGIDIVVPEVETVKFFQYDGEEVAVNNLTTTGINKIEVTFNTAVNTESAAEHICLYADDALADYTITDDKTDDDRTVIYINIPKMLLPLQKYSFVISEGIESEYSAEVVSEVGEKYEFTTKYDKLFKIFENNYDIDTGEYTVKIVKNDSGSLKCTGVATAYSLINKEGSEGVKKYKQCKSTQYVPIVLNEDDIGVYEFKCILPEEVIAQGDVEVETFLVKYPSFNKLDMGSDGEIN